MGGYIFLKLGQMSVYGGYALAILDKQVRTDGSVPPAIPLLSWQESKRYGKKNYLYAIISEDTP